MMPPKEYIRADEFLKNAVLNDIAEQVRKKMLTDAYLMDEMHRRYEESSGIAELLPQCVCGVTA